MRLVDRAGCYLVFETSPWTFPFIADESRSNEAESSWNQPLNARTTLGEPFGLVGVRIDWFRVEIAKQFVTENTRNFARTGFFADRALFSILLYTVITV